MEVRELIMKEKINGFAEYADKHDIFNMFHDVVQKMVTKQPIDPIDFIISYLQQPQVPSIIIHSITMSNAKVAGKLLANKLGCVHVVVKDLIKDAIKMKTSLGLQAEQYFNNGKMVPDNVVTSMIYKKLQEPNVIKKGWVLQGFPKTREQALLMKRKGIIPDSFIIIDIPEDVIYSYEDGLIFDPNTYQYYHKVYNPPPSVVHQSSLQSLTPENAKKIKEKIEFYNRNLPNIINSFKTIYRSYYYPKGIYNIEKDVANSILANFGQRPIIENPTCLKIVIAGLPGSGKTMRAEFIAKKYGIIHVSVENVILEEISTKSELGFILKTYINHYNKAPKDVVLDLIVRRLKKEDCELNGWVLDGYPLTQEDIDGLNKYDIIPNRLIYLNASEELCKSRLIYRRIDPKTGLRHNLKCLPPNIKSEDLIQQECDKEEYVYERFEEMKNYKKLLINNYHYKDRITNDGIMQDIEVDGIGEGYDSNTPSPTMNRAFEIIKGTLMRPVPYNNNIYLNKEEE